MTRLTSLIATLTALTLLAACGGGGGISPLNITPITAGSDDENARLNGDGTGQLGDQQDGESLITSVATGGESSTRKNIETAVKTVNNKPTTSFFSSSSGWLRTFLAELPPGPVGTLGPRGLQEPPDPVEPAPIVSTTQYTAWENSVTTTDTPSAPSDGASLGRFETTNALPEVGGTENDDKYRVWLSLDSFGHGASYYQPEVGFSGIALLGAPKEGAHKARFIAGITPGTIVDEFVPGANPGDPDVRVPLTQQVGAIATWRSRLHVIVGDDNFALGAAAYEQEILSEQFNLCVDLGARTFASANKHTTCTSVGSGDVIAQSLNGRNSDFTLGFTGGWDAASGLITGTINAGGTKGTGTTASLSGLIGLRGAIGVFASDNAALPSDNDLHYVGGFVSQYSAGSVPVIVPNTVNYADWEVARVASDAPITQTRVLDYVPSNPCTSESSDQCTTTPPTTDSRYHQFLTGAGGSIAAAGGAPVDELEISTAQYNGTPLVGFKGNGLAFYRHTVPAVEYRDHKGAVVPALTIPAHDIGYAGILPTTDLGAPLSSDIASASWNGSIALMRAGGLIAARDMQLNVTFNAGNAAGTVAAFAKLEDDAQSLLHLRIDGTFDGAGLIRGTTLLDNFTGSVRSTPATADGGFQAGAGVLSGLLGTHGAVGVFRAGRVDRLNNDNNYIGGFVAQSDAPPAVVNYADWTGSFGGSEPATTLTLDQVNIVQTPDGDNRLPFLASNEVDGRRLLLLKDDNSTNILNISGVENTDTISGVSIAGATGSDTYFYGGAALTRGANLGAPAPTVNPPAGYSRWNGNFSLFASGRTGFNPNIATPFPSVVEGSFRLCLNFEERTFGSQLQSGDCSAALANPADLAATAFARNIGQADRGFKFRGGWDLDTGVINGDAQHIASGVTLTGLNSLTGLIGSDGALGAFAFEDSSGTIGRVVGGFVAGFTPPPAPTCATAPFDATLQGTCEPEHRQAACAANGDRTLGATVSNCETVFTEICGGLAGAVTTPTTALYENPYCTNGTVQNYAADQNRLCRETETSPHTFCNTADATGCSDRTAGNLLGCANIMAFANNCRDNEPFGPGCNEISVSQRTAICITPGGSETHDPFDGRCVPAAGFTQPQINMAQLAFCVAVEGNNTTDTDCNDTPLLNDRCAATGNPFADGCGARTTIDGGERTTYCTDSATTFNPIAAACVDGMHGGVHAAREATCTTLETPEPNSLCDGHPALTACDANPFALAGCQALSTNLAARQGVCTTEATWFTAECLGDAYGGAAGRSTACQTSYRGECAMVAQFETDCQGQDKDSPYAGCEMLMSFTTACADNPYMYTGCAGLDNFGTLVSTACGMNPSLEGDGGMCETMPTTPCSGSDSFTSGSCTAINRRDFVALCADMPTATGCDYVLGTSIQDGNITVAVCADRPFLGTCTSNTHSAAFEAQRLALCGADQIDDGSCATYASASLNAGGNCFTNPFGATCGDVLGAAAQSAAQSERYNYCRRDTTTGGLCNGTQAGICGYDGTAAPIANQTDPFATICERFATVDSARVLFCAQGDNITSNTDCSTSTAIDDERDCITNPFGGLCAGTTENTAVRAARLAFCTAEQANALNTALCDGAARHCREASGPLETACTVAGVGGGNLFTVACTTPSRTDGACKPPADTEPGYTAWADGANVTIGEPGLGNVGSKYVIPPANGFTEAGLIALDDAITSINSGRYGTLRFSDITTAIAAGDTTLVAVPDGLKNSNDANNADTVSGIAITQGIFGAVGSPAFNYAGLLPGTTKLGNPITNTDSEVVDWVGRISMAFDNGFFNETLTLKVNYGEKEINTESGYVIDGFYPLVLDGEWNEDTGVISGTSEVAYGTGDLGTASSSTGAFTGLIGNFGAAAVFVNDKTAGAQGYTGGFVAVPKVAIGDGGSNCDDPTGAPFGDGCESDSDAMTARAPLIASCGTGSLAGSDIASCQEVHDYCETNSTEAGCSAVTTRFTAILAASSTGFTTWAGTAGTDTIARNGAAAGDEATNFIQGGVAGLDLGAAATAVDNRAPVLMGDGVSGFALASATVGGSTKLYAGLLAGTNLGVIPIPRGDNVTWNGQLQFIHHDTATGTTRLSEAKDIAVSIIVNAGQLSFPTVQIFDDYTLSSARIRGNRNTGLINSAITIKGTGKPDATGTVRGGFGGEGAVGVYQASGGTHHLVGGFVVNAAPGTAIRWAGSFTGNGANAVQTLIPTDGRGAADNAHFIQATNTRVITRLRPVDETILDLEDLTGTSAPGGIGFGFEPSGQNRIYYAGILQDTNVGAVLVEADVTNSNATWSGELGLIAKEGGGTDSNIDMTFNFTNSSFAINATAGGTVDIDGTWDDNGVVSGTAHYTATGATGVTHGALTGLIGANGAAGVFKSNDNAMQGHTIPINPFVGGFVAAKP